MLLGGCIPGYDPFVDLYSFASMSVMAHLLLEESSCAGDVHEKLGLPRNTISAAMARMEREGWAESWHEGAPWRGPARRVFRLTPEGRAVALTRLTELVPQIEVVVAALPQVRFDRLSADERSALDAAIGIVEAERIGAAVKEG